MNKLLFAVLLVLLVPAVAVADTIPAPYGRIENQLAYATVSGSHLYWLEPPMVDSSTDSVADRVQEGWSGYSFFVGGAVPHISGSAYAIYPLSSELPSTVSNALAQARYWWYFRIGPKPGQAPSVADHAQVPVDLDYTLSLAGSGETGSNYYRAAAGLNVVFGSTLYPHERFAADANLSSSGALTGDPLGTHHVDTYTTYNDWGSVYMDMTVWARCFGDGGAPLPIPDPSEAEALVRAAITLDDAWLADHPNDQVYFSVLASPVPIPGAVWLLGSGLVGLAGLRRKKGQISTRFSRCF